MRARAKPDRFHRFHRSTVAVVALAAAMLATADILQRFRKWGRPQRQRLVGVGG